jgi:3-hydroxybutyryl-CoA dehydrogenase
MTAASIAIVGAGRMGRGIALAFARTGTAAVLLDVKPRSASAFETLCADIRQEIGSTVEALVDAGIDQALDREDINGLISVVSRDDIGDSLSEAEVLFEAVPETLDAKREAFAVIAGSLTPDAIIASTSSTFLSTDIAALVAGPHRCLNAHWLNPAYLIPLVEVSPHPGTDKDIVERFAAFLKRHGKVPVMCAPAAGYIVPRLQSLIMNEAARMVQDGVATPDDIDKAIRVGFGVRYASMGVLEFIDFGGCDILHYASGYLAGALAADRFASPDIVSRHMREGKLGLKTGCGFYDWSDLDLAGYRRALLRNLMSHIQQSLNAEHTLRPRSVY